MERPINTNLIDERTEKCDVDNNSENLDISILEQRVKFSLTKECVVERA